jgi:hypothetical protein
MLSLSGPFNSTNQKGSSVAQETIKDNTVYN